ncbi:MAG TPA: EthD domain-containing protein [Dehalococcoidia bacterium]|nr:EthD domain-containing protein [Dehalococcoidia bacterium]
MIKLVYCLRRRSDLSLEDFQAYWRQTHAPLVAKHAQTLRIKRYVQVHTRDHPVNAAMRATRPGPEPYDGIAELWWDTLEDFVESASTTDGREAARELLEDEKRFIDLSQSPLWIADEDLVLG